MGQKVDEKTEKNLLLYTPTEITKPSPIQKTPPIQNNSTDMGNSYSLPPQVCII